MPPLLEDSELSLLLLLLGDEEDDDEELELLGEDDEELELGEDDELGLLLESDDEESLDSLLELDPLSSLCSLLCEPWLWSLEDDGP